MPVSFPLNMAITSVKALFHPTTLTCVTLYTSQEQQRLADRRLIDQRQQLFQLRSIKTSIKQREEKTKSRQTRRKANQEAQKSQPRRLGKLKYVLQAPPPQSRKK